MSEKPKRKTRRKFPEDFKKWAVRLSYSSERTVSEVADSLGVSRTALYRWRHEFTPEGDQTKQSSLEEEIRELHLRIAQLEEENDILKKASALFAKHQR